MNLLNKIAKIYMTADIVEDKTKCCEFTYGIIIDVHPNKKNVNSIIKYYTIEPLKSPVKHVNIVKFLEFRNCCFTGEIHKFHRKIENN